MNFANRAPLSKALIPLLLGISAYINTGLINPLYIVAIASPCLIYLAMQVIWPLRFVTFFNGWKAGVAGYVLLLSCGYLLCAFSDELNNKNHFSTFNAIDAYTGIVKDPLVEKENSYKTTV